MRHFKLYIVLLISLVSLKMAAQLSPGDLTKAHKNLEGMANCTMCHDLGNKVSNNKCLDCHKELKVRIVNNKGFHVSKDIRGKQCASCHSEHNGRNFDMIRFDEKKFNHSLTGYPLTGAHIKIDCRQCHKPDNIVDLNLKKRKETYLGLKQDCNSCHEDKHQKTLGNDCARCHVTEAFKPASRFSHDRTDFALNGKHKLVQCIECHKVEIRNGSNFQKFAGIGFKNCNSCHIDPHKNNLGTNCKECHSEQSFNSLINLGKFNHSRTLFQLKGKHKQINCNECHKLDVAATRLFQDRKGILNENCNVCHKDPHDQKFGLNCIECHNENSFHKSGNLKDFNHNLTDFPLKGKHEVVDCRKCHISEKMTDPIPHNSCASCHKDYHEGQFKKDIQSPDCGKCHNVEGFSGSLFSIEDHHNTKFPLEGAHIATPCYSCHKHENKWNFKDMGTRCVDCHKDIHAGQIALKWYPDNTCDQCHQPTGWNDNVFDHSKTRFKLEGKHLDQQCRKCHIPDDEHKYGKFEGTSMLCKDCHKDVHNNQFEVKGIIDCSRCHSFQAWNISKFDHNKTRFKLDGKHVNAKCDACHKLITIGDDSFVKYKFDTFECIVCHK